MNEIIEELTAVRDKEKDMELELQRLTTCYLYASSADKKVIWAVLNKYVPMMTAEGLL